MRLISRVKESNTFKKTLYYSIIVFLFLYVFSVPTFGESKSFTRYIIYLAMVCLSVASFGYCFLYENFKVHKTAFLIPIFCIFTLFGTIAYSHEFRSWITLPLLAVSFFAFIYSFKIIKNKYLIISIIASAFFVFSAYYIFHYRNEILDYRSYTNDSFRLGWDFDNPNGVSAYSVIGVSTSLYLVLFWNRKIRFVSIVSVLTSLLVGLTTGSRTFLLIVVLMVLVFLFFKFKKHKLIFVFIVIGLIGLAILLINLPFLSTLRDRLIKAIQTIFGTADRVDTSTLERTVMIDYGFYLGSKNIFFGYGVDGFSIVSGIGTYAHSNYAEVLCDFGLVGFILFYSPLFIFLFKALTNKRIDKSFVITFVAYYLIVSFSNVLYYKKTYYLVIALLFYFVFIESCELKKIPIIKTLHRVVFVCDTMGSGGAERVISSLSNEMAKRDIDVNIIGVADLKEPKSFYDLNNNVKYVTLANGSGKRINSLKRIFLLRKMITNINPDIVISFLPNAIIYTYFSLIGLKIPFIVSERNNPYIDPKRKFERLLKKMAFSKADGSVFQTSDAMNFYPKKVQSTATIIKNPIMLSAEPKEILSRRKTVLAVGRLIEQKNYECLIEAFSIFNQKKSNEYKLHIYGDGSLKNDIKAFCELKNVAQFVVFMGNDSSWHEKEIDDAMYVLSSNYEGMPNALAEAMALGIPSISTDCPSGGSRELIKDGVNGYLVPVNDCKALADKMILVSNQSSTLFYTANKNLYEECSAHNIASKWIDYIEGLTKEIYE